MVFLSLVMVVWGVFDSNYDDISLFRREYDNATFIMTLDK